MFELINTFHNDIDGTYCFGMLQYVGMEYGSRLGYDDGFGPDNDDGGFW